MSWYARSQEEKWDPLGEAVGEFLFPSGVIKSKREGHDIYIVRGSIIDSILSGYGMAAVSFWSTRMTGAADDRRHCLSIHAAQLPGAYRLRTPELMVIMQNAALEIESRLEPVLIVKPYTDDKDNPCFDAVFPGAVEVTEWTEKDVTSGPLGAPAKGQP